MKRIQLSFSPEKAGDERGEERKRATAERLDTLVKRQRIQQAEVIPSPTHTEHLLRLRITTLDSSLDSLAHEEPRVFHPEKTGPTSNDPNLGPLRHDEHAARRMVVQSADGTLHNVNPGVTPVTPVRQKGTSEVFVSPGQKEYVPGASTVQLGDSGSVLIPLIPVSAAVQVNPANAAPQVPFRRVVQQLPRETHVTDVKLSYSNFARPAGFQLPINNKKAQGGYSADELAEMQLNNFEKGLMELGLASQEQVEAYSKIFKRVHHEHTHKVASHFGILRTLEGIKLNPRDPSSTFVAPAALNTEMMLFEKFVDFLLYINYSQNHYAYRAHSVQFTCTVVTAPLTTQPLSLKLEIKDFHTGKTFAQTWDRPYEVVAKPPAAMYRTLLILLKASLDSQRLLGSVVAQAETETKNDKASRPF